jgi:hypothetical protein
MACSGFEARRPSDVPPAAPAALLDHGRDMTGLDAALAGAQRGDGEAFRALLADRSAELTVLLDSFRGTQEWGVKMYLEPWADGVGDDAFGSPAGEPGRSPRWGQAEEDAERIGHALSDIAVATRRHPFPTRGSAAAPDAWCSTAPTCSTPGGHPSSRRSSSRLPRSTPPCGPT